MARELCCVPVATHSTSIENTGTPGCSAMSTGAACVGTAAAPPTCSTPFELPLRFNGDDDGDDNDVTTAGAAAGAAADAVEVDVDDVFVGVVDDDDVDAVFETNDGSWLNAHCAPKRQLPAAKYRHGTFFLSGIALRVGDVVVVVVCGVVVVVVVGVALTEKFNKKIKIIKH